MEILNSQDVVTVYLPALVLLVAVIIFWCVAQKQRKTALSKIAESLKLQMQTNQQLGLVVNELRRSNRILAELADMEVGAEYLEPAPASQGAKSPAATNNANTSTTSEEPQFKLYVGNIDYTATEAELAEYFGQQGLVEFVNIPVNRYTGRARGFGFVTFSSREDAERAMSLHGTEFRGRQIQVNFAKERDLA